MHDFGHILQHVKKIILMESCGAHMSLHNLLTRDVQLFIPVFVLECTSPEHVIRMDNGGMQTTPDAQWEWMLLHFDG